MDLRTWIDTYPRDVRRAVRQKIATACGVTECAVRHWANGTRRIPAEQVPAVVKESRGKVTRRELRPDVFGGAK